MSKQTIVEYIKSCWPEFYVYNIYIIIRIKRIKLAQFTIVLEDCIIVLIISI